MTLRSLLFLFLASSVSAQTVGQYEIRKRTSTGFTSYGVTLSNGQVLGQTAGVPAAITLSGGDAAVWGTITGTLANQTDLNSALSGKSPTAGSTSITTLGTITTGTWQGTIIAPAYLGTGTSITTKFLRGDGTWQTVSGTGDALVSNPLSQFAATTSAQLRGVLSDESGTGEFLTTNGSAASLTSFPTLNQNTTGSAATLTTPRAINGVNFDGSSAITITAAAGTLTGTSLASNVVSSSLTSLGTIATGVWQGTAIGDSYISSATTWNAKESALTFSTGLTRNTNTITVNTSQNIATLSNLTSNGFVKTSGGTGALSVDTSNYQPLASILTTLAALNNVSGVLTNNGSGTLSYTATSGSGNVALTTSPTFTTPALGAATATSVTSTVGSITATLGGGVVSVATETAYVGLAYTGVQMVRDSNIVTIGPPATLAASYTLSLPVDDGTAGQYLKTNGTGTLSWDNPAGAGTVTSVGQSFTGGLISVAGSPITSSGTLALTVAGTSGGIPYFSSASTWASSGALADNALVIGGGAGAAPSTITTGTGVVTALGVNVGSAGAFITFNGDAGTPSALVGTNISGAAASFTAGTATAANGLKSATTTVSVSGATAPSSGQVLTATSSTAATWQGVPVEIGIACSDESTALTTGTAKVTFRMPFAMTVSAIRASVGTAPTGALLIVDINETGSTIMTTNKLSIDASEKTSTTAATAAGITDSTLADDAEITIDIDQIGSTIAGAGLKVWIIGTR